MFEKKDYVSFCKQLMAIEVEMEHEALALMTRIKNAKAVHILKGIASDELRHEKIVNEISAIIKKEVV